MSENNIPNCGLFADDERDELAEHFRCLCGDLERAMHTHDEKSGLHGTDRVCVALAALEALKVTLILSQQVLRGKGWALELEQMSAGEYARLRGPLGGQ